MQGRQNVRAGLSEIVRLRGTDRWGNPFEMDGRSLDFSRKGLGLVVQKDIVAQGTVVSVDLPNKLKSQAVVQWTRGENGNGSVRLGVRLINPKATWSFRLVATFLLGVALLSQVSFARERSYTRSASAPRCTVSMVQMKNMIQSTIGSAVQISDNEKAFVHLQHQQMSCEKYTKDFEKSGFFGDDKKRSAVEHWHWQTYHAQDEAVRSNAIQSAEAALHGTH
jgi:hypothetical protein